MEPPTLQQVIQFNYFLKNNYPYLKNSDPKRIVKD